MTPVVERRTVEVGGTALSYLAAGDDGAPPLLLLHGTFWSRVWAPVLPALGERVRCIALDLPGFGASSGELTVEQATVPALAQTVLEAADARYTLDLVPALQHRAIPTRLVWGRDDDDFQRITFARRYVEQIPGADLVEVAGKHIPTEDSPVEVAAAILGHLAD